MSKNWKLYEFTGKGHGHLYFMEAKCRICLEKGDSGFCSGEFGSTFHKRVSSSQVKHQISEEACLTSYELEKGKQV